MSTAHPADNNLSPGGGLHRQAQDKSVTTVKTSGFSLR